MSPSFATAPANARELVPAEVVDDAIRCLAEALQPILSERDCVVLGVMLGGLLPTARLVALLEGDFVLDYCHVTRYQGALTGGKPEWRQAPRADLRNRTVIVIDDIFDEGVTLDYVVDQCRAQGAAEVVTVALVRKLHDRVQTVLRPDFVGIEVEDVYVFGVGMDYRGRWRHLPAIYALNAE